MSEPNRATPSQRSEIRKGLLFGMVFLMPLLGGAYYSFGGDETLVCRDVTSEYDVDAASLRAIANWAEAAVEGPVACLQSTSVGNENGIDANALDAGQASVVCRAAADRLEKAAIPQIGDIEFDSKITSVTNKCRKFLARHVRQLTVVANASSSDIAITLSQRGALARSEAYLDVCAKLAIGTVDKVGVDVLGTHCRYETD